MLKFEERTLGQVKNELVQKIVKSPIKTTGKEATKGIHWIIYGPMEDIIEQAVNRDATDSAIGSRPDMHTKSQKLAKNL